MYELASILPAWLIGLLSGFLFSIPVGPINITIINEGARRGFRWALFIGVGSVVMELIYCSLGFAGFSSLFEARVARAMLELASFVVMVFLGVKYLVASSLPTTTPTVERVEHRLHPHTAFMVGFVRMLGNPAVLLFWMAVAATYISHQVIENRWREKWECIVGMGIGSLLWFGLLSFAVSRGHGRFSTKTLMRMAHISGLCLLVVAAAIGYRLVMLLAHLPR